MERNKYLSHGKKTQNNCVNKFKKMFRFKYDEQRKFKETWDISGKNRIQRISHFITGNYQNYQNQL